MVISIPLTIIQHFGTSVAVSNNTIIVGSYREDDDTTGANSLGEAGSVYFFTIPCSLYTFESVDICSGDSLFLAGSLQSTTGTYYDTLRSVEGCDSIVITNLAVHSSYLDTINLNICSIDSIFLAGWFQKLAGTYYDTLRSVNDCDSIVIANLTVTPNYLDTVYLDICSTDSVFFGGEYQYTSGVYFDLIGASSCDSFVVSILTVSNTSNMNISGLDSIYCLANVVDTLVGTPTTGTFSGPGIFGNTFNSNIAGLGASIVKFEYTDTNGCYNSIDQNVTVISCDSVWPGDVNNDGTANNFDLLPLGLYYNFLGPKRDMVDISWSAHFSDEWTTTQSNGINLKHADCNGDGGVTASDTLAIISNFGLKHGKRSNSRNPSNPDLYFEILTNDIVPGAQIEMSIMAGVDSGAVNIGIYGLAFDIQIETTYLESNSIKLTYANSWIIAGDDSALTMSYPNGSMIYGGLVRTDQALQNNKGEVARLHFIIDSTLSDSVVISIDIINSGGITETGDTVAFNFLPNSTGGLTVKPLVGINDYGIEQNLISVYPNPTTNQLYVQFDKPILGEVSFKLFSHLGNLVYQNHSTGNTDLTYSLDMSELSSGIYFLEVNTTDGKSNKKVVLLK